jgi:hypothetical protein
MDPIKDLEMKIQQAKLKNEPQGVIGRLQRQLDILRQQAPAVVPQAVPQGKTIREPYVAPTLDPSATQNPRLGKFKK